MANARYDFAKLEAIYVAHDTLSVRELAKQQGIPDSKVSAIHNQARKKDSRGLNWYEKRAERQAQSSSQMVTVLARKDVERKVREAQVLDNAVELMDEYITGVRESLREKHFVHEPDKEGELVWVERPRNPATIGGLKELLDRMERFFGKPLMVGGEQGDTPAADAAGRNSVVVELAARIRAGRSGPDGERPVKVVGAGPGTDPSGS